MYKMIGNSDPDFNYGISKVNDGIPKSTALAGFDSQQRSSLMKKGRPISA
jgi:hypothetical protein